MIRIWQLWLMIVALAASLLFVMARPTPTAPVNLSVPATPAPQVRATPRLSATAKAPVKVYAGGAVLKRSLKLPAAVAGDPASQVIAASQVRADDHPQTVTTVINTDTGISETYVKRDPLPWLAWDTRGEAGMYVGLKNGAPAVRVEAKQGLVQAKALHVGVIGSLDQPLSGVGGMDTFVGVGIWTKW